MSNRIRPERQKNYHVWTEDDNRRLTEGWLAGRSCYALGKEIGVSKNAVVGRKSRLGLPDRVNPAKVTLNFKGRGITQPPIAAPAVTVPRPPPKPRYVAPAMLTRKSSACCWPFGDPGTKAFRFCDDTALLGRPYCELHCACAYTSWRRRLEAA